MDYICNKLTVHKKHLVMFNTVYNTKLTFNIRPTFYSFLLMKRAKNILLFIGTDLATLILSM